MTEEYLSRFESAVIYHKNEFDCRCVYLRKGKPWEFATNSILSEVENVYCAKVTKIAWSLGGVFADVGLDTGVLVENCDFQVGSKAIIQIKQDRYADKEYKATTNICIRKGAVLYFPCDNSDKKLRLENKALSLELNNLSLQNGGRFSLKGYYKKVDERIVLNDAISAVSEWKKISKSASEAKKPTLLKKGDGEAEKLLFSVLGETELLLTNDNDLLSLQGAFPFVDFRLVSDDELFSFRLLDSEITSVSNKKIQFKNGSIAFDYTEAFTAIDVNSDGSIGRQEEKPWLQTNLSATGEIVRQLRLRNIGGAIVIDFISMESQADKEKIINALCDNISYALNVRVFKSFTNLGHVELTRKRGGERKDILFLSGGQDNGLKEYFSLYRTLRELKESVNIKEVTVYISDELLAVVNKETLSQRLDALRIKITYESISEKGFVYRIQI